MGWRSGANQGIFTKHNRRDGLAAASLPPGLWLSAANRFRREMDHATLEETDGEGTRPDADKERRQGGGACWLGLRGAVSWLSPGYTPRSTYQSWFEATLSNSCEYHEGKAKMGILRLDFYTLSLPSSSMQCIESSSMYRHEITNTFSAGIVFVPPLFLALCRPAHDWLPSSASPSALPPPPPPIKRTDKATQELR